MYFSSSYVCCGGFLQPKGSGFKFRLCRCSQDVRGLALGMFRKMPNVLVATCLILALSVLPGVQGRAQVQDDVSLEDLFSQLKQADDSNWQALEQAIQLRWTQSGSAAMDLLYSRAKSAIEAGDLETAFAHLGALTDHAPDFAEGWHLRATAFFRAERFGLALDSLRRALALEPRHFDALEGVAVVMETLNESERALAIYNQVLAIHPRNPDVKEAVSRLRQQFETAL